MSRSVVARRTNAVNTILAPAWSNGLWCLCACTYKPGIMPCSWEALLIVMDNRPFPELRKIVREANDSRIWVHAEWVSGRWSTKATLPYVLCARCRVTRTLIRQMFNE